LNNLTDEEKEDLKNDPLCFYGATAETDIYGPPADCCYGYELPDRVGKYWAMCLRYNEKNEPVCRTYDFGDYWAQHTWAEEFSSFWCGPSVKLECKYRVKQNGISEFADDIYILLGGQINDKLGKYENLFTWCEVCFDDGNYATLWHETKCDGKKYNIKIDVGERATTCDAYDDISFLWTDAKYGWKTGQVASVTLASGNALELFQKIDYDDHSYTVRNFGQDEACYELHRSFWVSEPAAQAYWASYDGETSPGMDYGIRSL